MPKVWEPVPHGEEIADVSGTSAQPYAVVTYSVTPNAHLIVHNQETSLAVLLPEGIRLARLVDAPQAVQDVQAVQAVLSAQDLSIDAAADMEDKPKWKRTITTD